MVLVEPPPGYVPEATPAPERTTITQPDSAAEANKPSKQPASTTPTGLASPIEPSTPAADPGAGGKPNRTFKFREDFEASDEDAVQRTPRRRVTPAPPKQTTTATSEPAVTQQAQEVSSDVPEGLWQRYRQWIVIGGAAMLGVILALVVFGLLSSGGSNPVNQPQPLAESTGAESPLPGATNGTQPNDDVTDAPQSNQQPVTFDQPRPPDASPAVASDDGPVATPKGPQPADPQHDSTPDQPPSTSVADSSVVSPADIPPDLAPPVDSQPAASDTPSASDAADSTASKDAASTPRDSQPGGPPAGPATAKNELSADVAAQLAFPFVEVELGVAEPATLIDLADFVLSVTTIPVTLDIDRLLAAGVTVESEVEVQLRGTTVARMLTAALDPLGLEYVVQRNQLLIIPKVSEGRVLDTRTYDVSDLATNEAEMKALVAEIHSLVCARSWLDSGGEATLAVSDRSLEIQQTAVGQFEIAKLLDQLRTARGLLPRTNLPPDQLDLSPAFVRAAEQLDAQVDVHFSEPTEMIRILEYLRTETDLQLLVDWQSLVPLGLQPSTTGALSLEAQPLRQLLDNWLAPLQLDYRVIDPKTIQIGSRTALLAKQELVVYPTRNLPESEANKLIQEIKTTVGQPFFDGDNANGVILFDSVNHCLLVSLPQPQQRQLADWLHVNRKIPSETGAVQ